MGWEGQKLGQRGEKTVPPTAKEGAKFNGAGGFGLDCNQIWPAKVSYPPLCSEAYVAHLRAHIKEMVGLVNVADDHDDNDDAVDDVASIVVLPPATAPSCIFSFSQRSSAPVG